MQKIADIDALTVSRAIDSAAKRRTTRSDFAAILRDKRAYINTLLAEFAAGTWERRIHYRAGEVTNVNGKHRIIHQPDCHTLILQHVCIALLKPYYAAADTRVALNCKDGCGLTARRKQQSVIHRLKHVFYDCRQYTHLLKADQRKCYDHIRKRTARRMLKRLRVPAWLNDFTVTLGFIGEVFPVGTPLSPLLHHIVMLSTDKLLRELSPHAVRYADDVIAFFQTKAEAQAAKWRLLNLWWYDLDIRAKSSDTFIQPLTRPVDYCGVVYHRNAHGALTAHDKGYTTTRRNTVDRAFTSSRSSYPSYFGQIKATDGYSLLRYIEERMQLQKLTQRIRIDRALDAPNIDVKQLAEQHIIFCVHDYEIRYDKNGTANWIKCLISYHDAKTNRRQLREFHGNYQGIIAFHVAAEKELGKDDVLPLTRARVVNACGYIYEGSTNMIDEIDDNEIFH